MKTPPKQKINAFSYMALYKPTKEFTMLKWFILLGLCVGGVGCASCAGDVSAEKKESSVREVDAAALDKMLENGDKVVIDFYATWCGPCKKLAPEYEKWAAKYTEAKFVKVDIDKNPDLLKRYGVTAVPTLFVHKKDTKVELENNTEDDLKAALKKAD